MLLWHVLFPLHKDILHIYVICSYFRIWEHLKQLSYWTSTTSNVPENLSLSSYIRILATSQFLFSSSHFPLWFYNLQTWSLKVILKTLCRVALCICVCLMVSWLRSKALIRNWPVPFLSSKWRSQSNHNPWLGSPTLGHYSVAFIALGPSTR